VFDWRSTRAVTKFSPDGIFDPTCLTVSSHGLMSIGSGSGIVSMFKKKEESWDPKPIAELGNLTTEVTELAFNSSGEILALSSTEKDNAIRLVKNVLPHFNYFSDLELTWFHCIRCTQARTLYFKDSPM